MGISLREFARRDGCDPKRVRTAVKTGHLIQLPDGGLDPALVGTGWRKTNRRGGDGVGTVPAAAAPLADIACTLVAMADSFAGDASIVLLRHLPLATVRSIVAELLASARRGAIDILEEDGIAPPVGTVSWAEHPAFTNAVPTEHEWVEAIDLAEAGEPI